MNKRFCIAILLVLVISTSAVGATFAQTRVPGVSVGNEFTYTEKSFWVSSNPNLPQPAGLADVNNTDYYRVTVTAVSGSNVSTHTKWHFTNGTDVEKDGSVSTETTDYQGGFWAIIGSNLNASDRVHPNSEKDLSTINETLAWDYNGYQRQTNHLALVFNSEKSANPTNPYTENVDTYFDRQTGVLIQLEDNHAYSNPQTILAVTWRLVSQNAWTGSETSSVSPLFVGAAVVIVALAVVILVASRYLKKRQAPKDQ